MFCFLEIQQETFGVRVVGSEKNSPSQTEARKRASCLFQEHEDFIRSVIRFAIRNPADADDFYQDLYLSFILNPPADEIRKPRGFFYRLIRERAKDWYRKHARRQKKMKELFLQTDLQTEPSPQAVFADAEEMAALFDKIESCLKTNEGRAILYRYKYDYTLEETAQKMGIKPKSVVRYTCTGLKKIREIFQKRRMHL
jgi:RNA polymerase sigma factor (sigma-70 family)